MLSLILSLFKPKKKTPERTLKDILQDIHKLGPRENWSSNEIRQFERLYIQLMCYIGGIK